MWKMLIGIISIYWSLFQMPVSLYCNTLSIASLLLIVSYTKHFRGIIDICTVLWDGLESLGSWLTNDLFYIIWGCWFWILCLSCTILSLKAWRISPVWEWLCFSIAFSFFLLLRVHLVVVLFVLVLSQV